MAVSPIEAARRFLIEGEITHCRPLGNGHINKTYLLVTDTNEYTLQKINGTVFSDIPAMMDNIVKVTTHIEKKRATVTPVKTLTGDYFYQEGKDYYRVMNFFDGIILEKAEKAEDMFVAGEGFGQFQRDLSDFTEPLKETIKNFHNTPLRYNAFLKAAERESERRKSAAELMEKYVARRRIADILTKPLANGKIPLRVTHNDTKINNLVLSKTTGRALCVIDLDTVMPGSLCYDFGDAVRSGGATAPEDEPNTNIVRFMPEYYTAFLEGFGSKVADMITENESALLFDAAMVMTYECGLRFLTDYLSDDVYFSVNYPNHNLVRAAAQMALLEDMERHEDKSRKITELFFR